MNLGEMKDWVVSDTKRPEKRDDQVQNGINSAIEWATARGDFSADVVEDSTPLSSSVYAQSVVIADVMPRFRKVKYLRPLNYRRYLTWRDPTKIFEERRDGAGYKSGGHEAIDVWYRAGANLILKLSTLQTTLLYGYYTYPAWLTSDADTHWMLEQMASCIHDLACWRVYEQIGNESEATRFFKIGDAMLNTHIRSLKDGAEFS